MSNILLLLKFQMGKSSKEKATIGVRRLRCA
jgi:hypothetical protein